MMNKRFLFQILLSIILIACDQENEFEYALIQTGDVTSIDNTGATFHAKISDFGKTDILEYGFVWNDSSNPDIHNSEKYVIKGSPSNEIISQRIHTTLKENIIYSVRAFVRNSKYITYGKEVQFTSLGSLSPDIIYFYTKTSNINDTLYILGRNFSYNNKSNDVFFGQFPSEIIQSSQDTLIVRIPEGLNKEVSDLSVSIHHNKSTATDSFRLVIPVVNSISPGKSPFGSTIQISGANFLSNKESLKVRFNLIVAEIVSVVDDLINVKVPLKLDTEKSKIIVEMNNLTVASPDDFSLELPRIKNSGPQVTMFGAEFKLTGKLFTTNAENLRIFVDKYQAEITTLTENEISFIVPDSIDQRTNDVSININGMEILSENLLTIGDLKIDDFSPKKMITGNTFVITGNGFSPVKNYNKVMIGNAQGEVIDATIHSLTIKLPLQDQVIYRDRDLTLSVEVLEDTRNFNDSIIINDQWFRRKDFPGNETIRANYFVDDNNAYVGLNDTEELWRFNPEMNEWTKMRDFPGPIRSDGAGFYLDGNIYFGTGLKIWDNFDDFWQYNIASDSWTRKNHFSGPKMTAATGFSINNKGYITSGYYYQPGIYNHPYEDCWEYTPESDSWRKIESYGDLEWGGVDGVGNGAVVVIDGSAYYGIGWSFISTPEGYQEKVFKFTPDSETKWKRIASFPEKRNYHKAIAFALNGKPYFKTVDSDFYQYNEATDSWSKVETKILSDVTEGIGFVILGKAYVGLGNSKTIWEYDPVR